MPIVFVDNSQSENLASRKILGRTVKERIEKGALKSSFERVEFISNGGINAKSATKGVIIPSSVLISGEGWKKLYQTCLEHERLCEFSEIKLTAKEAFLWNHNNEKPQAERWLLQSLIKENEGFMSRHFERKISLFVTRLLIDTPVTPNQMTIFSVALGLAGALLFLVGEKWYDVAASLLFWLHSVLDGCDGEIARLKFQESRYGGLLDFWGDNVVHCAVFLGIALGQYSKDSISIYLGLAAVLGTVLSASWTYFTTMQDKKNDGPVFQSVISTSNASSSAEKAADFLARRDFIYLVILLSAFGQINKFLWMGALGAPLYFLTILYFRLRRSS